MSKEWSQHYSVGHEHIDDHHEELFHLVSKLDIAIAETSIDTIHEIVRFLENHMAQHLIDEEKLMDAHIDDYADIDYHKREHDIFRERIGEIRATLDAGRPLPHLVFQIRRMVDRLVDHIITVDQGIATLKGGPS